MRPVSAAPQRFGRFKLLRPLHDTPAGDVWLAAPADARSEYPTEMAFYRWPATDEGRAEMRNFAHLLQKAGGPGLQTSIESAEDENGTPYLVSSYVASTSFSRILEWRPLDARLAAHVASEVLRVMERMHAAGFASGSTSTDSVHLSDAGDVLVWGLENAARLSAPRAGGHRATGAALRALAPEVARGDTPSPRADVYGVAVLLLELLLGEPWAPGADLDVLSRAQAGDAAKADLEALGISQGLRHELLRALSANPMLRHADAAEFADNLAPFCASEARASLAQLLHALKTGSGVPAAQGLTAPPPAMSAAGTEMQEEDEDDQTSRFHMSPSFVRTRRGERVGPLSYAQLVEKTVGGAFAPDDMVELMGAAPIALSQMDELARLLPAARVPTKRPQGFTPEQSALSLLAELSALYTSRSTAVLSVQRAKGTSADVRHLHLKEGIVTSVDTREPGDLLGEYLVASGQLPRTIVDEALAALPRYKGQLGQALIGEGAASSLFVFRAIVMHLTRRFVSTSQWEDVFVAVENTTAVRPVLFPVRLCVPQLMYEWLEAFERGQGIVLAQVPAPAHELGPFAEDTNLAHDVSHPVGLLATVLRVRKSWAEALAEAMALGLSPEQAVQAWHVLSLL